MQKAALGVATNAERIQSLELSVAHVVAHFKRVCLKLKRMSAVYSSQATA
tara:strand:+ start:271 stop:420 length:150 start_codon:yes stop_codon:yes gene_type:complete